MTKPRSDYSASIIDFLNNGVTPFHVQQRVCSMLQSAGGTHLHEADAWNLTPGALYYIQRNDSSVIAFRCGKRPPAESGFRIVGAHTDSPSLKIKFSARKPPSTRPESHVIPVEVYGAPLLYTWLDRSLGIAGRVMVTLPSGRISSRIVNLPHAGVVIPSLAIHMDRNVNEAFSPNPHQHLPVLISSSSHNEYKDPRELVRIAIASALHTAEAPVHAGDVQEADLFLYDAQSAEIGGIDDSLLVSGRIDNLAGCFTTLEAFLSAEPAEYTQVAVLFDVEEIGSRTAFGADSGYLSGVLQRVALVTSGYDSEAWHRSISLSRCVSNDGAHAVHPTRPEKHDADFSPVLNGGPIIKLSASYRYATTAVTAQEFRAICESLEHPYQYLTNRADIPAGSTIGPFTNAHTQIPTVDVGIPMLAMHSIRETAGIQDIHMLLEVLTRFYSSSVLLS
ncbi:MAG: M18 family aminopeptidase [Spirochaeta sp.]